ncbi:MAG TPA: dihydrolipoamide acetyltransferase family protein [Polyangia bacterium]
MAYEFRLPDIGEGMAEGEIVRWLVNEGDVLRQDQPMVEIMTDKATVEIASPRAGKVLQRCFKSGERCPVGEVLVIIDTTSEAKTIGPTAPTPLPTPLPAPAPAPVKKSEAVLATPAVRKLARDMDVDLTTVTGSGPGGQITAEDVRSAKVSAGLVAPAPRPTVTGDVRIPFRGVRRKIAEHMLRTQREVAQFTYVEEVDATELVELRAKAEARLSSHGIKLSYLPFFIKAVVDALKKQPQLNAYLDEKAAEIVQRHEHNIGLAAQTPEGLMVPVIRNADKRSLLDLAREVERVATAARTGHVSPGDLGDSTFTITSLGTLGGIVATPIINYPEVAILAVHKIVKRPVVVDDTITIREMMNLSLSVDHRMVDGYDAAKFVAEIKSSLETPGLLFLESY